MTRLLYRGVSYDNSRHEQPSAASVEHSYRGHHFNAPLRHEAAAPDTEVELHYRGQVYHHRAAEAAEQVNHG